MSASLKRAWRWICESMPTLYLGLATFFFFAALAANGLGLRARADFDLRVATYLVLVGCFLLLERFAERYVPGQVQPMTITLKATGADEVRRQLDDIARRAREVVAIVPKGGAA